LARNLNKLKAAGFKQVFIDTMPAVGEVIRQVVDLADLVLIPCRPSPDDLDAVGATVDLVEEAGKPLIFVVNGATKRARLTGQAAAVLSQHGTVALAPIHHSVAFPSSAITGESVSEVDPASAPAREVAGLWGYVLERQRRLASKQAGRNPHQSAPKAAKKEVA
jgi:chromosome partitioning protein